MYDATTDKTGSVNNAEMYHDDVMHINERDYDKVINNVDYNIKETDYHEAGNNDEPGDYVVDIGVSCREHADLEDIAFLCQERVEPMAGAQVLMVLVKH